MPNYTSYFKHSDESVLLIERLYALTVTVLKLVISVPVNPPDFWGQEAH